MGTKKNWFDAVKKVFSPRSEEKKTEQKSNSKEKPKKKWRFSRSRSMEPDASIPVGETNAENKHSGASTSFSLATSSQSLLPQLEEVKEVRLSENDGGPNKHAYSVALASAVAAEAAAVAAQAAAEVVRLTAATKASVTEPTGTSRVARKSKEEIAAIRIQTVFRGFLARRALRALRGLVRLKALVDGSVVKRQTEKTIHSIQAETRIQFEIHARRRQMVEENQAIQRQLQLKQKEEKLKEQDAEDWNKSVQTKEQIDASIQSRQEAAIKRERALAYAFTHQWRNSSSTRIVKPTFIDPTNPQWGWSWVERWMAARPWENHAATSHTDKQLEPVTDRAALKSALQSLKTNSNPNPSISRGGTTTPTGHQSTSRPPSRQSPSTPTSKPMGPSKVRSASPKPIRGHREDDARSVGSTRSERARRHSVAGSMVGDDVSLTSLTSLPVISSYLQSTESSRAKSRSVYSPISEQAITPDKGPVRKRLTYPLTDRTSLRSRSPSKGRRFSGPPKLELGSSGDGLAKTNGM